MIPKEIYFYWGNKSLSFLRYMTLYSFRKYNPDWIITLILKDNEREWKRWETGEQNDVCYSGKNYLGEVEKLGVKIKRFKSDFITDIDDRMMNSHVKDLFWWYILSTCGGFVADMDILFVRSFDVVYKKLMLGSADIALTCFTGLPKVNYIPVTFMGGSCDNPFFKDTLLRAKKAYNPCLYECCGSKCIGFNNITEIQRFYKKLKVVRLPDKVIYPFITEYEPTDFVKSLCVFDRSLELDTETVGIHWYGGGLANFLVNELTEDSYKNKYFTMAKLIQKVVC